MIRYNVLIKPVVDRAKGTILLPKLLGVILTKSAKVLTIKPPQRNIKIASTTNINFLGTMRVVY